MEYKLVWTERARADLHAIVGYIASDRPSAVSAWGEELFRHVEVLASFPLIGPVAPIAASHPTRRIVFGDFLIFYRVHPESKVVEILSIWHAARGLPEFL
jgi:plasmid stabilization system protein ParE